MPCHPSPLSRDRAVVFAYQALSLWMPLPVSLAFMPDRRGPYPARRGNDPVGEKYRVTSFLFPGVVAEPYHFGRPGAYVRVGTVLTVVGAAWSLAAPLAGGRSRIVGALSGAALLAACAATRWGIFHAGIASADDPKYTVIPQRERPQRRT